MQSFREKLSGTEKKRITSAQATLVLQESHRGAINVFSVIVLFLILFAIGFLTFILFFGSTPRVEVILPASLQGSSEISKIQFVDLVDVVSSGEFTELEIYNPLLGTGPLGRNNPFIDYIGDESVRGVKSNNPIQP